MTPPDTPAQSQANSLPPIAAIGASAGGLEAVSELLSALPADGGIAYVFVQHLDPNHESLLPEILGKRSALPVTVAIDGVPLAAGRVYVIPPDTTLTLANDCLKLSPREPGRHMPVDIFLKSLARARGARSISVVLSGGDSDGALGTRAIKHAGGITFAQDPTTARFPSMPRSAIETGCVDFVLRPAQIGYELARLIHHPYLRAADLIGSPEGDFIENDGASEATYFRRIFALLRSSHGVDFANYKRSTLQRRMARRMALKKLTDVAEYVALLESDSNEVAALFKDFLIRVTEFFRDPLGFEAVEQQVLPTLCADRSPKNPIRIWIPGCSTGEEVYSLAILLVEYLGDGLIPGSIQFFGTDVSSTAIDHARAGIYLDTISQDVTEQRLKRFFVEQNHHFKITKSIRDLCIFSVQDVTRDPPFSRLDMISCRNLLIYLDAPAQRRVMNVFHYALRGRGVLMLGSAESVGRSTELFELIDKQHRLYRRREGPLAADYPARHPPRRSVQPLPRTAETAASAEETSAQRELERTLLARYAPAGVLIDDGLNVLQFHGETGPFLQHASGPPSVSLHRILRTELLAEVSAAIKEVRETQSDARREGLAIGDRRDIAISVIPMERFNGELSYLIMFEDGSRPPPSRGAPVSPVPIDDSEKDRRLAQAEREIASLRAYLREMLEEHEAVQEALKSAHEEVLSANEEFQSTNEELETSQEELQSANEELTTTNDELRARNHELADANTELEQSKAVLARERTYADAIIETVSVPLLVLEGDLTIIRANHVFYADFRLAPEVTIGRFLYDIGDGWDEPGLRSRLDAVLTADEPMSELEVSHDFPRVGHRVVRLTARKIIGESERPDLILLAIEDITERRAKFDKARERNRRKDNFLAMLAHELRNPLTPISNAIHLLRASDSASSPAKLHDIIARQTTQLTHLVNELLDVARLGRGLVKLNRETVDLTVLVQDSADATRTQIEERAQTLSLSLPGGPIFVSGDPIRLEQAIANLLENASKYTDSGGKIAVTLQEDGGSAVFSVRDTGIGIDPARLDEVFDLFSQVDASLARSSGGLGIGLTVVRRVVELHGGSVEARSAGLGHGSEFVIRVPMLSSVPEQVAGAAKPELDASRHSHGRRVLIVDDNEDAVETLAQLARSWGHEVAVAYDGPSALSIVSHFQPECALIDIGLPGMTGYEVARHLRASTYHRDLQLIAVTGYGRAEDKDAARAAGFDAHMTKPVGPTKLRQLLEPDTSAATSRDQEAQGD